MNKKLKGIYETLKTGYSLGCWASGGRVPIVAIIDPNETTVASGEGEIISESFIDANSYWIDFAKSKVRVITRDKKEKNSYDWNQQQFGRHINFWMVRPLG